MDKLNKTAKTLDTVFKVLEILAKVGFVAMLVCTAILGCALLFNIDPNVIGTGYTVLDLGNVSLTLAESVAPDTKMVMIHALVEMIISVVVIFLAIKFLKCVRQITNPMTEGTPFHESIVANLKKLGWYAIVLGVISNIAEVVNYVISIILYQLPDRLQELFVDGMVTHVEFNTGFDWTFLLMAGVLFLMSYIFDYGAELQKLSDETL